MFKVGDIVIGNKKANKYNITKSNTIWKVLKIYEHGIILICCAENVLYTEQVDPNDFFNVETVCFDLYKKERKTHLPKWL